ALIVLEVALSCAIICNAVFLINDRMQRMDRPSGLAESEIVRLQLAGIGRGDNAEALSREDVAALSAIPEVKSVALTNQLPFSNSSWNSSVTLAAEQQIPNLNAATYLGDEQLLETLGLRLVAGRDFTPDEYVDWGVFSEPGSTIQPHSIIITGAVAERLNPAA